MNDALAVCKAAIDNNDPNSVSYYSLKLEPEFREAKKALAAKQASCGGSILCALLKFSIYFIDQFRKLLMIHSVIKKISLATETPTTMALASLNLPQPSMKMYKIRLVSEASMTHSAAAIFRHPNRIHLLQQVLKAPTMIRLAIKRHQQQSHQMYVF